MLLSKNTYLNAIVVILGKVFVFHCFFCDLQGRKSFWSTKKRTKCIKRPANSMKPKLLFEGRKRRERRSSLLIIDEQMRTQLAAVVSFRKMTLLVLTFSRKSRLFAFADDSLVLSQILSIWNYVSAFTKKAITMKQCSLLNTALSAISMIVCYANFVF